MDYYNQILIICLLILHKTIDEICKKVYYIIHRVKDKQLRLAIREVDSKGKVKKACLFVFAFRYELEEN